VDPVPDPLLLRKSGSFGNRIRDLWICSQEFWPLDHRGGRGSITYRRNPYVLQIFRKYLFQLFLVYHVQIKCKQMSNAVRHINFCKLRSFRHLESADIVPFLCVCNSVHSGYNTKSKTSLWNYVLMRMFRFKPASQLAEQHRRVVSCTLNMEDHISNNFYIFSKQSRNF
jgi:hypothetical protein